MFESVQVYRGRCDSCGATSSIREGELQAINAALAEGYVRVPVELSAPTPGERVETLSVLLCRSCVTGYARGSLHALPERVRA